MSMYSNVVSVEIVVSFERKKSFNKNFSRTYDSWLQVIILLCEKFPSLNKENVRIITGVLNIYAFKNQKGHQSS